MLRPYISWSGIALGKGGTPPLFFCKNVILEELYDEFIQECDSKGFAGGESSRWAPDKGVTRLISMT